MAELRRLKQVVDCAAAVDDRSSVVCYLLDEILHGTNSAERQIAARRVIRHLVELGAIGAVSTHDLTLADDPRLAATAVQAHFGERVIDQSADLGFDYILRPGPAPTTNALRLMALVGLPSDE
jgi:DNA mismatch repair ATPase MutS